MGTRRPRHAGAMTHDPHVGVGGRRRRIVRGVLAAACRRQPRRTADRAPFTLIELLVVISIVAILMSMLLPALNDAKSVAKRAACASNQKQCAVACISYADDNAGVLPPSAAASGGYFFPNLFYLSETWAVPGYDLRPYIVHYLGDPSVWRCGEFDTPPMTDPANTRGASYSNLYYFPGLNTPGFGGMPPPARMQRATKPSAQVMIQDLLQTDPSGIWAYGHGRGSRSVLANNPSFVRYLGSLPGCAGCNLTFYDGHVEWVPRASLQNVGTSVTTTYYSRLP